MELVCLPYKLKVKILKHYTEGGGIPVGTHHILFVGGINKDIFKKGWELERKAITIKKESGYDWIITLKKTTIKLLHSKIRELSI